jgi:hypothetical protein
VTKAGILITKNLHFSHNLIALSIDKVFVIRLWLLLLENFNPKKLTFYPSFGNCTIV